MSKLLGRLTELLRRPWHERPRLLAMAELIDIRNDLREQNLHDSEEPPLKRQEIPADLNPALRTGRSIDGTFNDLHCPTMGAAGRRFGRNFASQHVFPDTANLLVPNPRVVSLELMTRDTFQPATVLNLLAASWIQFMVHDWFVHKRSKTQTIRIPIQPGDAWGSPEMTVPRTEPDPAPPVDATAGICEREQPLVGFVAHLRLRCGNGLESPGAHWREAANRADRATPGG